MLSEVCIPVRVWIAFLRHRFDWYSQTKNARNANYTPVLKNEKREGVRKRG
jgi:hypothetical protein